MQRLPVIAALVSSSVLIACDFYNPEPPSPSVVAGEALFTKNCSSCHPRTGRGDYLKRIPVTLLNMKSKHELTVWIRGAGQHREMPSFENLSEEELDNLADYLHNEITK